MGVRWLVVLLVAVALVGTPLALGARPVPDPPRDPVALARLVRTSATWGWSGTVRTAGALQVPESESFATLGQLLGEDNQLRVWWRGPEEWRVDRLRSTGETDLFRSRGLQVRWVFESDTATVSPVSRIRLPDTADLLPATLARSLLQGVRDDELGRLPALRVAGVVAPGLRITPDDPAASVAHVDVWVEPGSGLPLRVEVYGAEDVRPVLSSIVTRLDLAPPDSATTVFRPAASTTLTYEDAVDAAAAANALAPYDLPATLAGLPTRGEDPAAVGIYGRGPTALIALPLRGQVARPLRDRLAASGSARQTAVGTVAPVGPVSLLVTPGQRGRGAFLLAGTVTPATLERAATELLAVTR
ncbi:hypothetical protein SAMN04488543_3740 [Friedmanniella luteola]|uniref:Sigma E regulatory protein, MucB/RseB n=1 Tax=Friedmanniella luteola TaxID=546871 RepID=A0A1H1ZFP9_9ACTN|nr:hypothetical protein [Friedmanniella luteola]SDT32397.1 hypothetical protein SAMN04488543_3740 [Friedmanniella luteola]